MLDPTIALIVRDATLVEVAMGVAEPDMTSFFDPNRIEGANINDFDEKVRAAVTKGDYKIRDGIYDFPSVEAAATDWGSACRDGRKWKFHPVRWAMTISFGAELHLEAREVTTFQARSLPISFMAGFSETTR